MNNFIYVFDVLDKDILVEAGYHMLRCDDVNSIYVFTYIDQTDLNFSCIPTEKYVLSNILTF